MSRSSPQFLERKGIGMRILALLFFTLLPSFAFIANPDTETPLQVVSRQNAKLIGVEVGRTRCDAAGNLYSNISDNAIPPSYVLTEFSRNGAVLKQLDPSSVIPGFTQTALSVLPDGAIFVVGTTQFPHIGVYVIGFSTQGLLASKVELQTTPFGPTQFVAFPTGELLVSGVRKTKPVTQLFNADGSLLKDIYEPEDEGFYQRAEAGELKDTQLGGGNTAVWRGDAVLGSDGNAYLLRSASPALIYVISHSGVVLDKLKLESPYPGLAPRSIKAAPGKLAVSFLKEGMTLGLIKIITTAGKEVALYSSDTPGAYPGLPGCYNGSSFVFLSRPEDKELVITTAK